MTNVPTNPTTPGDSVPNLDELLGAYALDAVDGDERFSVEHYLASNHDARREVDELRETAAMLALAPVDHEVAPPELWTRISGAIASADAEPNVVDLATMRARRRSVPLRVAAPVAAAAAALIAVLGIQATQREYGNELASDYDDAASGGSVVDLVGSQRASVALVDGRGVLRTTELAELDEGQVYQAWAVYTDGGAPISIGVFGSATDYTAFDYGDGLAAVAITVEDAPGVVTSTQEAVAVAALT
jgi:hypothetical protein